ncbi:MAG: MBL fold metallo-hydrolase [Treponema sp.]|jgi:phosphoribosyl 1,2-cyclic phosphate phosphodiesterase|nr:MBL fold metallo-hydrolase [Treponema sp.]
MKLTYLGTAAAEGWPAVFCDCESCEKARKLGGKNIRTRSQTLIDKTLLVDLSPDTYFHSLRDNLQLSDIITLLITHSHQDHFYPEELIMRGEPYAHNATKPLLTIYGNDKVHARFLEAMKLNDSSNLDRRIRFQEVKEFIPFTTQDGYRVIPVLANHDPHERCLLYIIEKGDKRILYANDTGIFPPETWEFLKNIHFDLASFDCTGGLTKDGFYHMGLPDVLECRDRLIAENCMDTTTKLVLTHFSHNGKLLYEELVRHTKNYGFTVAYDGMNLNI